MNNNFVNIVKEASSQKRLFDTSIEGVKVFLNQSIVRSDKGGESVRSMFVTSKAPSTGWLRGSLSYPWAIVCIIIPAVFDSLI